MNTEISGEVINDPSDDRMQLFTGLRDQALRQLREAPGGDMEGIFIAEGDVVIQRALDAGNQLHSVIVEAARARPLEFDVGDTPLYRMGEPVVQEIASHRRYRGAMAAFHRPALRPLAEVVANARTAIVTEGVNNPTNMGVMLRTAAALGVEALLVDPTSCDPLARRTCRVSMGAVFAVPHTRLGVFPDGLDPLHDIGFTSIALTPDPDAQPLDAITFEAGERVALLLGAEEPGLTPATQERSTHRASIPMHQGIDSLNVATAAAIAMWHVTRARQ
jgi:tRNA G18 (ribose-2'-O)-methylase SpoU